MADDPLIGQIEQNLKWLYAQNGEEYKDQLNEAMEALGMEAEEIKDELDADLETTQLVDDDFAGGLFPWIEGDNRNAQIYDIFQKCYKDPDAYNPEKVVEIPNGDKPEHWNLTEKDHGKVKSYMETAAASIWEAGFQNDGVLKSMVAVDLKMGRNYLQFLADMYMREVIYHKVANNRDFKLEAGWKNENEHIASLFNMKAVKLKIDGGKGNSKGINTPGALVCGAIKSYFGRVAPKLQLNATNKIKGDLKTAAHHVLSTTAFVANLHTKQCPFQYDAVFAFDGLVEEEDADADDDDDDDDADADDDDTGGSEKKIETIDSLSEIKQGLEKCNLVHEQIKLAGADATSQRQGARILNEAFSKIEAHKQKEENLSDYPRNKRMCSIVDMRSGGDAASDDAKDDAKSDDKDPNPADVLMFESAKGPGDCAKVPTHDNTAMGYFHRAKSVIIPDAEKSGAGKMNATTSGPHFTLSYHVDEQDNIRCYFYFAGQCARFLPEDIKLLLPLFFEETVANKEFANSNEALFIINSMRMNLIDAAFNAFMKEHKVKYIPDELAQKLAAAKAAEEKK